MPDYRKMYFLLFNKLTDIIEEIKAVQIETEENIISCEEVSILFTNDEESDINTDSR